MDKMTEQQKRIQRARLCDAAYDALLDDYHTLKYKEDNDTITWKEELRLLQIIHRMNVLDKKHDFILKGKI